MKRQKKTRKVLQMKCHSSTLNQYPVDFVKFLGHYLKSCKCLKSGNCGGDGCGGGGKGDGGCGGGSGGCFGDGGVVMVVVVVAKVMVVVVGVVVVVVGVVVVVLAMVVW